VLAFIRGATEVTLPLIGTVHSWQAAFICVGAPGFLVALLLTTVKEPRRHIDSLTTAAKNARGFGDTLQYLKQHRYLLSLQMLGYTCMAAAAYGTGSWVPTYLIRVHHMKPSTAGISYGIAVSILGTLGGVAGGLLGDRLLKAGRSDARIVISIAACLFWIPAVLVGTQTSVALYAVILLGLSSCFSSVANGLGPTTIQDIVPGWLRGQTTALYFFVLNLIGLGLGPTAVALVTDRVFGYDTAVRYSIPLVVIPLILLGAALLWAAKKQYQKVRESLLT
jgi:MFS family permease